MNYLFIDIECANCKDGGKLCEFGYVLTDEDLNFIKEENVLMNPDTEFDVYVLNQMLNFDKSEYLKSQKFDKVYKKIYHLLTQSETLVVGHTVGGDAVHIGDDCVRYGLPTPDFSYVDIVELYKTISGAKNATSLVNMCKELSIETGENVHSAGTDAKLTAMVAKRLCENKQTTLWQLIQDIPQCRGSIKNYSKTVERKENYKQFLADCERDGKKLTTGAQSSVIRLFKKWVLVRQKKNLDDVLAGKAVCLSGNLELTEYNKTLQLIQQIKNAGGITVSQPTKCDLFVRYDLFTKDGREVFCKKLDAVCALIERGKKIEIVNYLEFIKFLGVSEKDFEEGFSHGVEKYVREKTKHAYSDNSQPITIGELIKSKTVK